MYVRSVHADFPVGDGLYPNNSLLDEFKNIVGFTIEYSNNATPNFEKTTLDYYFSTPDIPGLMKLIEHCKRIVPNNWECSGKEAIIAIIQIAIYNYIK